MRKTYRTSAWLAGLLLIAVGGASAEAAGTSFEIAGTLQEAHPGSGYVVMDGKRYRLEGTTAVISNEGEKLSSASLAPGSKVLLRGVDQRVDKIFVLPADSDLPHH
ncbi:MAG: hypothetical protein OQK27_01620 [Gammaproteobacteria bacterium]|nr:hypothetical protein [Gammaproteobacteria bacterium]MCW9058772.1 hypothetical protein [Gammaproteobacteria bacterium]